MKLIRTLEALRYLLDRLLDTLYRRRRCACAYDLATLPWQDELLQAIDDQPLYPWLEEPFTPFGEIR